MTESVCAIVVTYKRKVLLTECLAAVLSQTHPVTSILVIDNASNDGTADLFASDAPDPRIRYVRLDNNLGGAGGFHKGLELASEGTAEWFWLMDDDTVAKPDALAELISAWQRFPIEQKPRVLASKVEWTDGSLHPMNFPTIRRASTNREWAILAAQNSTLWVRWASFVSLLLHRSVVKDFGLPFADYFIWNDDTEDTARILREELGVLVPASVVVHKTPRPHGPQDASPERSYYQVRNVLWMILRSDAWTPDEKVKIGLIHLQWILRYLARSPFRADRLRAVFRGLRDGLVREPAR